MLVAVTSALAYPKPKLFAIVAVCRALRFLILSYLAIRYGERILHIIATPGFKYTMIGFAILCVIVSGFSIAKWVTTGRAHRTQPSAA